MRQSKGFTLLEVLVALVIISVALTAIFYATMEDSRISAHLRDKTMAHWVGLNEVTRIQLQYKNTTTMPQAQSGTADLFSKQWIWNLHPTQQSNPYYWEFDLEVRPTQSKQNGATLTFFLRKAP